MTMCSVFAEILPPPPQKNHLAILRLIVLRSNLKSNLAKFANLSRQDPHLENVNSLHSNLTKNLRRFASAKLCRHP
ncbi:hypothetical protein CAMRE0001_2712 [Campylobacter rectus RM3267]|uniref:Uncharacterized protein n=1 Tax=Campylobacter rectus RM3267 TaxID=553218 RepID=B9D0R6_CAMRE|nr:hypothetical protein CAMRE0001_2712 [Campylobacter rectus RM3267]